MPRSKNLHIVRKAFVIEQPNDPAYPVLHEEIDMATELSRNLGRTIKQNQNFRVVGWGAFLTSKQGGDVDSGGAAAVQFAFAPTTKWSVKGHKMLQDHYWKQSGFRKGLGINSKYDEFEVALGQHFTDDRTSKVFVGGIDDPKAERCTIYGGYDDEDGVGDGYIAAQGLVNAKYPVDAAGTLVEEDLLFDDNIHYKPAKFVSLFPQKQYLAATATFSSQYFYDHDVGLDEIYESGAIAASTMNMLPDGNHINALCGRIEIFAHMLARDDENILADELVLHAYFLVEGWSPLHYKPKRKSRRRLSSKRKSTRRTYRKRKR